MSFYPVADPGCTRWAFKLLIGSKFWVKASSWQATLFPEGRIPDSFLLHKVEEVIQSLKNLESLLIGSHPRE
uniref:Uncharacterized protein n=1 Tax=Arundo donax TaxID=35708 RepID=A0A0A9GQW1_ARUDO